MSPSDDAPEDSVSPDADPETSGDVALPMPIVGIGASAGGIDALRTFFDAMPAESGMAFAVVLHLAPDRESNLADILAKETVMTVEAATEDCAIHPNHVYVIPPGRRLGIEDGVLHLSNSVSPHDVAVIDSFFRSLAADQRENAVGIVLSGTGTDGTLGLRTIKEEGGITMVQDPNEAEYDNMPRSALSSGLVDLVLPTPKLAQKLVDYRDSAGIIRLPDQVETLDGKGKSTLHRIFTRLYTATDHDFSNYKQSMVLRRLERRMQLQSIRDLDAYLDLLRRDKEEVTALYKDLLISVTSFFRDPEAFEALADRVIPALFEHKDVGGQVRVWVPGCATGEEAYSLAMLLVEYTDRLDHAPDVQVFATDVDEEALQLGREGLYPKAIQADVTNKRLNRFFEREGDYYRVKGPLREQVLFAKHNLLTDPHQRGAGTHPVPRPRARVPSGVAPVRGPRNPVPGAGGPLRLHLHLRRGP